MVPAWRRSSRRKSLSFRLSRLLWTSLSTLAAGEAEPADAARVSATAVADAADAAGLADAVCAGAAAPPLALPLVTELACGAGDALRLRGPCAGGAGTDRAPAPAAAASDGWRQSNNIPIATSAAKPPMMIQRKLSRRFGSA